MKLFIALIVFSALMLDAQTVPFVELKQKHINADSIDYIPQLHPEIRIVLALSGGGTRGIAHVALLNELETNGLPVYGISGTSIGSVVGALYASGYSPQEILEIFRNFNWDELYSDKADRKNVIVPEKEKQKRFIFQLGVNKDGLYFPSSLSHGQRILNLFTKYTSSHTFHYAGDYNKLSPRLAIVATDMLSGQRVVFHSGNLASNMLASMAFPLLFAPVEYDSMLLIDGGISDNIPVDGARQIGGTFIIASDVTAGLRKRNKLNLPWEIADQVTTIMMQSNMVKAAQAHVVVAPDLKQFTSTDFNSMEYFYAEGKSAASNKVEEIYEHLENTFHINARPIYVDVRQMRIVLHAADKIIYMSESKPDTIINLYRLYYDLEKKYKFSSVQFSYSETQKKLSIRLNYSHIVHKIGFVSDDTKFLFTVKNYFKKNQWNACLPEDEICENINRLGWEHDYLGIIINTQKIQDSIVYKVEPFKIDSISISGNLRTRDYIIERELAPALFQAATITDLIESLKNIYGTGLFDLVEFFPYKQNKKAILNIKVKEKPYLLARFGLHHNMDFQTEFIVNILEKNILGRHIQLESELIIGPERRIGAVGINTNRIYNTNYDLGIRFKHSRAVYPLYVKRNKVQDFVVQKARAEFSMGKIVEKLGYSRGTLYFQQEEGPASALLLGSALYRLWGINFSTVIDNRNTRYFASSGYYLKLEWESLNYVSPTHLNTARMWLHYEGYKKIGKYSVIDPFFSGGIAENTIPYLNRFWSTEFNRASGQHLLEMSGKMFLYLGTQWRQQIFPYFWGEKYISFKLDINGFWNSSEEQIQLKHLQPGGAVGLHLASMLGPLEFQYEMRKSYTPLLWMKLGFSF